MRPGGGTARASVGVAVAAAAVLAALLLPGAAAARKPVISHLDGNQLSLYDAETGKDSAPLPVAIADPNTFRYGISKNGRFVFFNDANKKLHLLDRNGNREVPLPGIDIYANPGFLTVSNFGLLAFDDNANGPAVVYDSNSKQFVPTGFAANSGHRQTQLSGTGEFLATTCMQAGNCVVDPPSGVAPFVQSLASRTNAPVADDPNRDEEDPCIDGGGVLSGWHKSNPVKKDVFIFDRIAGTFVSLPNLNTAGADETFCVLDAAGDYVGFARENVDGLQLYQLSSASLVPLPASVEAPGPHRNAIFSAPPCARRFATQIGSAGRDVIKGTPGEDVILALEGNDKISGLNGKDVICGGKGKDKLIGGRGRDRLLGEQGSDVLKGGKGRDVLKGGKGRDDVTQ